MGAAMAQGCSSLVQGCGVVARVQDGRRRHPAVAGVDGRVAGLWNGIGGAHDGGKVVGRGRGGRGRCGAHSVEGGCRWTGAGRLELAGGLLHAHVLTSGRRGAPCTASPRGSAAGRASHAGTLQRLAPPGTLSYPPAAPRWPPKGAIHGSQHGPARPSTALPSTPQLRAGVQAWLALRFAGIAGARGSGWAPSGSLSDLPA
jgi:hypothetical protein